MIIKSFCAKMFYKLINKFMEVKLEEGSQDFRMMKRNVVDAILSLNEYNRFSKGIFNWVGFKCKYIEIENVKRAAGAVVVKNILEEGCTVAGIPAKIVKHAYE